MAWMAYARGSDYEWGGRPGLVLPPASHAIDKMQGASDRLAHYFVNGRTGSHPPGYYLYPAWLVLDQNGRFQPCGLQADLAPPPRPAGTSGATWS